MTYDYNQIASVYDLVRTADHGAVVEMAQQCQLSTESAVLEIGCGTANYLTQVQASYGSEIWGLDASAGMLQKAKAKCPEGHFLEGDATLLEGVPENHFDLVYMVDVIHHIKDINSLFHAVRRVLKPGGKVFVFSDHYAHIRNRLTTRYFPETLSAELSRYQDYPELRDALQKNHYQSITEGQVLLGTDPDFGPKLLEIAKVKGYSMFGLITEDALAHGIALLESDISSHKPIPYEQKAPFMVAQK